MSTERLKERVATISSRVVNVLGRGEEATKQALVLPMLEALGFDIWDPTVVCPEYEADFAVKKAGQKEKVDLAVLVQNTPVIFIEVKPVDASLDGHHGQLGRYFNGVPTVRLGILTNGVEYRFFTDTREPNLQDEQPFFVFRVDGIEQSFETLCKFHASNFQPAAIRELATDLIFTSKIVHFLKSELDLRAREPGESFVRWVLNADNYEGRVTAAVVDRFRPIVKSALQSVLLDIVRRSFAKLDEGVTAPESSASATPAPAGRVAATANVEHSAEPSSRQVVTTEGEISAFELIKGVFQSTDLARGTIFDSSLRREVPLELGFKDTTAYFGVYFNKVSSWFVRLQLDSKQPWVAFSVPRDELLNLLPEGFAVLPPTAHGECRVAISSPSDLLSLRTLVERAMERTAAGLPR
ncbi:MAG: hypothetical protein RLZZ383_1253 [Pseudomonadota bacterium]|jgi:hypothetical protein